MTGARQIVEAVRELPDGLDARPTGPADVADLTALMRASDIAGCGHSSTNADEVRDELGDPDCGWGRGSLLVRRGAQPVGALITFDGLADGRGWMMDLYADEDDPQAGAIRAALIDSAIAEGRRRWAELPADPKRPAPVAKSGCYARDSLTRTDLEARGFAEVRRFWRMRIDHAAGGALGGAALGDWSVGDAALDVVAVGGGPVAAAGAGGYTIRRFHDSDADWRGMHAAFNSSFQDHFDFTPMQFDSYREHLRGVTEDQGQWLIAERDGVVAGYARGSNRYASEGCGYVASLGVVREHRGAGVAKALLRARFADDIARGFSVTLLHVDASSPTGATRLYESVGMRADSEILWLHRPLFD